MDMWNHIIFSIFFKKIFKLLIFTIIVTSAMMAKKCPLSFQNAPASTKQHLMAPSAANV